MDIFKTLVLSTPGAVGSSVAITGGSINGTNIGATTPGTGAFTTLTSSSTTDTTSTTTGGTIISGGLGVAKNIFGGQRITASHSNNPTYKWVEGSTETASIQTFAGDLYIAIDTATSKNIIFRRESATEAMRIAGSNGVVSIAATTASTTTANGALVVSGGIGAAGAINAGTYHGMVDGIAAPGATAGYAKIYVDTADGDLKVIFGDGTVKTIATDT